MPILDTMHLSNIYGNVIDIQESSPVSSLSLYAVWESTLFLFFLCTSEVAQKAKDKACAICLNQRAVGERKGKH